MLASVEFLCDEMATSKNFFSDCGRLIEKIRYQIERKIESILSPVAFDKALETYSGYLISEIPQEIWTKFFKDTEFEESQKREATDKKLSIDHLSIFELIIISLALPPLKTQLSEKKIDFEPFLAIFEDFNIELLIRKFCDKISTDQRNRLEPIESKLIAVLDDFGFEKNLEDQEETKEDFADSSSIFLDQVYKKIDKKLNSDKKNEFNELERNELEKLVKKEREKKRKGLETLSIDSFATHRISVNAAIQLSLSCYHCQRMVKDPRTLPCLHVFCGHCLKSIFNANENEKQSISCPSCQTRISLPTEAHIDQLPRGFISESLIRIYDLSMENSVESPECNFCIKIPSHVCFLCCEFYCENHIATIYKHGDSRSHADMISPISSLINGDKIRFWLYNFCPQHRQRLTLFCPGCRVPLCSHQLCLDWHSKHADPNPGLSRIEDAIMEERQKLQAVGRVLIKKAEAIGEKIDTVEKNQITAADVQENIRQSIEKYFADMEEKLARHKLSFLSDLDKAAAQCFQNDENIHEHLQKWKETTDKYRSLLNRYQDDQSINAQAGNSLAELSSLRYQVSYQLSDSCSGALVAQSKRISYPETKLRDLQYQIGTMQSSISSTAVGRGWENVIKFSTGVAPSAVGTPLSFAIDNLRNIAYVIKNRGLVTSGQILAYDLKQQDNRVPAVICDAGSRVFESVAVDRSNRLFVAEPPQNMLELPSVRLKRWAPIRIYDFKNGAFALTRTLTLQNLNTYAKSIVKFAADRFYACDGSCVCEYDAIDEFKLIRKFNFHNMLELEDFAVDPRRDFVYVIDSKKHTLLIFDCRYQVIRSVGEQGVTPGRFEQPAALALDEYGHVFVADAGNLRVQIFDLDGKFLRFIQYPQSIKEISANNQQNKINLQVADDCLYMFDSRSDHLWRYRYV